MRISAIFPVFLISLAFSLPAGAVHWPPVEPITFDWNAVPSMNPCSAARPCADLSYRVRGTLVAGNGLYAIDTVDADTGEPDGRRFPLLMPPSMGELARRIQTNGAYAEILAGAYPLGRNGAVVPQVRNNSPTFYSLRGGEISGEPTLTVRALREVSNPVNPDWRPDRNERRQPIASGGGSSFTLDNVRMTATSEYHAAKSGGREPVRRWGSLTVDAGKVRNVYFVLKPFFPAPAAHSLLLFTFDEGGLLDPYGRPVSGLVLSVEAVEAENEEYDIGLGHLEHYTQIWLMTTWEDYAAHGAIIDGTKFKLRRLALNPGQKRSLVVNAIDQATLPRSGELYHTITNNCTNSLMLLLNTVIADNIPAWDAGKEHADANIRASFPAAAPGYLRSRGLLRDPDDCVVVRPKDANNPYTSADFSSPVDTLFH